ncbi:phosphoenolpyruvate synthase Pps, partial [Arthrobacter crystallopoietes BAB-32]
MGTARDSVRPPGPAADRLTVPLAEIGAGMLREAGGKAVNLGVMLASGLPVPDGFCLTTAAYRQVAAGAGLEWLLAAAGSAAGETVRPRAAAEIDGEQTSDTRLAKLARQARSQLTAAPVPEHIERELRRAYAGLGADVPVAVRSSATAEDLPEASFAGQQDTFLNVVGAEALLEAVRKCWASLWTERAVAYRSANGIGQQKVRLAVVIQRMVDATVSGVMFTANPLTGTRGQTVIDASPGLGEATVSGAVNPDHFVLDSATGEVLERTLGDKQVQVRPASGGGTERLAGPGDGEPSLTHQQLHALAGLGREAQELFGEPQDLEWAIGPDGVTWLVQSRPITTLYPRPEADESTRAYLCASLLQGLTRPLTPMGLSAFEALAAAYKPAGGGYGAPVPFRYLSVGLRLFVDVTPLLRSAGGRRILPRLMKLADDRSVGVLKHLMADPRFSVIKGRRVRSPAQLRRSMPQLVLLPSMLHALFRPTAALQRARRAEREFDRKLQLPEPATAVQRLDFVEQMLTQEVTDNLLKLLPPPAAGYLWLGLARWLLGPLAQPGELQAVLRGLPHNVTTEMDLKLWDTAAAIGRDPAAAQAVRTGDPQEL